MIRRFWVYVGSRLYGEFIDLDSPDVFASAQNRAIREVGTTSASVQVFAIECWRVDE
jgi:hypothetical protein